MSLIVASLWICTWFATCIMIQNIYRMPVPSKASLNLKATELRFGLSGSQSPKRNLELCLLSSAQLDEKPFSLCILQVMVTAPHHRRLLFQATKEGSRMQWMDSARVKFLSNSKLDVMLSPRPSSNLGLKSGSVLKNLGAQHQLQHPLLQLQYCSGLTWAEIIMQQKKKLIP